MTIRLTLVRHGRPDGSWGRDADPGLDRVGHAQANTVADALAPIGPLPVVVSPMRRTLDTAAPLAARWGVEPWIEPGAGELGAPHDADPDPQMWLRALMAGTGATHGAVMHPFRDRVLRVIRALETDTVVVTHFLAINAVVGAATDDDRVVCFAPAHCSRTSIEVAGDGAVRLVELGTVGDTVVNL